MTTGAPADSVILKVLSGVQSGVEVVLHGGEYTIGTGPDDDVQLIDVSLRPGHLRLRLSSARIEIAGAAGSFKTHAGLIVGAGSEWQAVDPLDIVTAGTTRFALGPPSAQWATVADDDGAGVPASGPGEREKAPRTRDAGRARILLPLLALLALVSVTLWYGLVAQVDPAALLRGGVRDDVQAVRSALEALPFARRVDVRQDVDGAIFVNGYTDTPAERRAVVGAVERTAVPARMRVWVLDTMRTEIENLVKAERLNVTATLSPEGVAVLEGLVLNEAAAARFVSLLREQVLGLSQVESRVRTARILLGEVERLGRASQIAPNVLFRLDGELVEANGAIPVEKVDAWVGFLQAYSQRFAQDIPLRSFVQLQSINPDGRAGPVQAITIGAPRPGSTDEVLDVERLRRGQYSAEDVFAGRRIPGSPADTAREERAGTASRAVGRATVADTSGGVPVIVADAEGGASVVRAGAGERTLAAVANSGGGMPGVATAGPVTGGADTAVANRTARRLVERWRDGTLSASGDEARVKRALDALAASGGVAAPGGAVADTDRGAVAARLIPLLADPRRRSAADQTPCWGEARLTRENLPTALFWLDLASVSDSFSLKGLPIDMQALVVEAAMNPTRTARCAKAHAEEARGVELPNVYLMEIARNPAFVRFVTRDMPSFQLDISGVSLGQGRYVQIRNGQVFREGAAPDAASRIAVVAELGVAIQQKEGLAAAIYGPEVNWIAMP